MQSLVQEWKTVDELADYLKVPRSFIYARTRQTGPDSIPRLRVGKYLRFDIGAVMEWLQRHQGSES